MNTIKRDMITGAALAAALVFALGFAGSADFEEEQRAVAEYCEMVAAGHWPAYRGDVECVTGERVK